MIIARIAKGIAEHLPGRASEWALATMLLLWGVVLFNSLGLFSQSYFIGLARIANQYNWAILCSVAGAARLLALAVNGTFGKTWWSRFSPHVRAVMAFMACFYWFTITLSILGSEQLTTGVAVYPVLFALDAYNVVRASSDARHSDEKYKDGRYS